MSPGETPIRIRRAIPLATAAALGLLLTGLAAGCSAATRYRVLSTLFDGVPPPADPASAGRAAAAGTASPTAAAPVARFDHGPYAAKLCDACHDQRALNALVAPADQLCSRCHELALDRRYVHGPVAAGACRSCHEPHGSSYRYLLTAAAGAFCLDCHDARALSAVAGHGATPGDCTACHDAHQSDRRYLLR